MCIRIKENIYYFVIEGLCLLLSLGFGVVSLVTSHWGGSFKTYLLDPEKKETLSIVGVSVLILLALICIIMSLIILLARVFGHAKGRARLAAGSSFTAAIANVLAMVIMHILIYDEVVGFGATYGLLWATLPLLLTSGVFFCIIEDDEFLA